MSYKTARICQNAHGPSVTSIKLSTVGNWAFQIATIYLLTWNDLSDNVNSAQSLLTFR